MLTVYKNLKDMGFTKIETQNKGDYKITEHGFKSIGKIKTEECQEVEGCTDLFTIKGDYRCFKRTNDGLLPGREQRRQFVRSNQSVRKNGVQ